MVPIFTALVVIALCLFTGIALGVAAGEIISTTVERWVNR